MLTHSCPTRPILLALALFGTAACSTPSFDITPRISNMKFEGTIAAGATGVPLQENDVDSNFGLGETSRMLGGRIDADFGSPTLTFGYTPMEFEGDGVVQANISHDGQVITAGQPVHSEVDLQVYSLLATFDLVPSDTVELGIGLGVHSAHFESTIRGVTDTVSLDETAPIPVLAARAGVVLGPVDLSALASGLKIRVDGDDASYLDLDLMARLRFFGDKGKLSGALVAGWRKIDLDLDFEDGTDSIEADLGFEGFFYGLSLGF